MSQHKERTVAYPHRIIKKGTFFPMNQNKVVCEGFTGFESITNIDTNEKLVVRSKRKLSPKDGRVFDYVLSRIQAISKENIELTFCLDELVDEMEEVVRTENRKKIIKSLNNLLDVNIKYIYEENQMQLSLLEEVQILDSKTVRVKLSSSFNESMKKEFAKARYINISRTMSAKSNYSIDLAKVLMMYGRGVVHNLGTPNPVREISNDILLNYLSLNYNSSGHSQLRKAFKELESLGYPKYSFSSARGVWTKVNT